MNTGTIHIEGWLNVPHSFAFVNHYQIRDLLLAGFSVSHENAAFLKSEWSSISNNIFEGLSCLQDLPSKPASPPPDFIYTIFYPLDLRPRLASKLTLIFSVNEYQELSTKTLDGNFYGAFARDDFQIVTPSAWSKVGYLKYGFRDEQVKIIPHGYDDELFSPIAGSSDLSFLGVPRNDNLFYFGSQGTMTFNKGVDLLVEAFLILADKYPHIRLILKDASDLGYPNVKQVIGEVLASSKLVRGKYSDNLSKISVIQTTLSQSNMSRLYNFTDCYVSPYRAEGFGLTPLEAAGCGCQVIVTRGGSTEEYFNPSYMSGVESTLTQAGGRTFLKPSIDSLLQCMENAVEQGGRAMNSRHKEISNYFKENHSWPVANRSLLNLFASNC